MSGMKREELLEEVEWQLSFGMHPIYISEVLERSVASIYKAAWRSGNMQVASHFNSVDNRNRARKKDSE